MENQCKACGMATEGFKCLTCQEELAEFDIDHVCGSDMLQPKCTGCNQAESNCGC
ncbi:MAG: hypothetical protein V1846_02845 [Candidatus Komeilibacteria bacterium]